MSWHLMSLLLRRGVGVVSQPSPPPPTTGYSVSGSTENTDANGTYCPDGTFNDKPVFANANGWHIWYGQDTQYETDGWVISDSEPNNDLEAGNGWAYVDYTFGETPPTGTYYGYFAFDDVTVSETTCS